jgi:hypothetical protein
MPGQGKDQPFAFLYKDKRQAGSSPVMSLQYRVERTIANEGVLVPASLGGSRPGNVTTGRDELHEQAVWYPQHSEGRGSDAGALTEPSAGIIGELAGAGHRDDGLGSL